jgi:hypothetical protein
MHFLHSLPFYLRYNRYVLNNALSSTVATHNRVLPPVLAAVERAHQSLLTKLVFGPQGKARQAFELPAVSHAVLHP